ncbi:MAG: hypothetical protein GEU74_06555 [Nitriliruptorales bacterium]|nr:hypothetical protein [Nitriliruptorales bacterium]
MDEITRRVEQEAEAAARAATREETAGSVALWLAVLGSPGAWAGHLGVNYALEEWFACSPSAPDPGNILGVPVGTFSVLFNSTMLAVAVTAGVVAFACLRRPKDGEPERAERARWMAFAGVVEGALFTGIILLGYIPPLVLPACQTTP